MTLTGSAIRRAAILATALGFVAWGGHQARAQMGAGDIVVGVSLGTDSFRVYDASSNTWSNGPGWVPNTSNTPGSTTSQFIQSVEFDNSNNLSHNANGNLLGANFGNGNTGFELFSFATDGTAAHQSLWSIVTATGGTKGTAPAGLWLSERGGGVAVSPDNTKVAWTNYDTGQIYIHDYSAGATAGTGTGATLTGPRRTALGDGNGNAGSLTPLRPQSTTGSTWLSNTKLVAFSGFGELITVDVAGVAPGTENGTLAGFLPTETTNWKIANNQVTFTAQGTDIEYNPQIDPNHIYASVVKNGTFDTGLYVYDYNTTTGAITLNTTLEFPNPAGNFREPREIAFDAAGNLYMAAYAGSSSDNLVLKLANATNLANWTEANVQVFYAPVINSSFTAMDVAVNQNPATGLPGDFNDDDKVDAADYTVWRDNFGGPSSTLNGNGTGAATVVQADYDLWKASFGNPGSGGIAGAAVPEPASVAMLLVGLVAIGCGRRRLAC